MFCIIQIETLKGAYKPLYIKMKREYPRYKQGSLNKVEKKLSKEDKEILKEFLKKCSITASEKKVGKIKRLILQLFDVTQISLRKQNKKSVDSFLVLLNKSDKSLWTKNEIKIYIKQFLLWLYKDPSLIENFKTDNRRELNPQKITENNLITEKDVEKMLRFAQSYKEKAYLLLAFQTGARPQELAELKWKDVSFQDGYADITLFSGKTKKSRTFPVVKQTKEALFEWKQHYAYPDVTAQDYVFVGIRRGKPMCSAGLNKILRRMSNSAGLNKDCWNYLLRHSRATALYEKLPQQIVEKLMGHKNMAGIYAHISSKQAREAMLNKIYHIEELTGEGKDKLIQLEKGLEELKKKTKNMDDVFSTIKKAWEIIIENEKDPNIKEKLQALPKLTP